MSALDRDKIYAELECIRDRLMAHEDEFDGGHRRALKSAYEGLGQLMTAIKALAAELCPECGSVVDFSYGISDSKGRAWHSSCAKNALGDVE